MNTLIKLNFIILIVFFNSCKSKEERAAEKLNNDLKTYFVENLQDSTSTLDSFKLEKIDTVTQKMLLIKQSYNLSIDLNYMVELYKIQGNMLTNSVEQIKLLKSIDNYDLAEMKTSDFKKQKNKANELKKELDKILVIIESLNSNAQKADSLKPIGFQAICSYQLRLKDKSIKQDTAYITLNKNKDIISYDDFLKVPYKVDFDKFR